jgi:DNA-binding MarR family transcriptional regulator
VFSSQLTSHLRGALTGPLADQVAAGGRLTGAQVLRLPAPARIVYQHAYVSSLRPVFVMAAAVAAAGFALSMFLPQRKLREAPSTSTGLDDSFAAPRSADSLAEVELALTRVTSPEERERFRRAVAERSGVELSPGAIWALIRIDEHGFARARAMAVEDGVKESRIAEVLDELRRRGLLAGEDGGVQVTPAGAEETQRVVGARRELLREALDDEDADRRPEVSALLNRLARELCGEPPSARADTAPAVVA